jgi:site-specific recombinase XerD
MLQFYASWLWGGNLCRVSLRMKLPKIGWHTLRHSYRSWLGSTDAKLSEMKDMMRHADVSTTMDYGGTSVEEMRPLHEAVASKLKAKSKRPSTTR